MAPARLVSPLYHVTRINALLRGSTRCAIYCQFLGGLLSSARLGYIKVLQLGGIAMLLSTVLMAVSVFLKQWNRLSIFSLSAWLLLPVFNGLIEPNVLYGILLWRSSPRLSTILCAVNYAAAATGQYMGLLVSQLADSIGSYCTIVGIAVSAAYLLISATLPQASHVEFEMPTLPRMNRYFHIFGALILFLVGVVDDRSSVYLAEMNYYRNSTTKETPQSPEVLVLIGLVAINVALVVAATCVQSGRLPVQVRIQAGILLQATLALGLAIFNAVWQSGGVSSVLAFYSVASFLDAVAAGLTMVASYELMDMIAPRGSKALVIGIMFTVWSLANIFSRLLVMAFVALSVLHPEPGQRPLFYVYHLTILLLLIMCYAYYMMLSFPLVETLTIIPDQPENSSLLPPGTGSQTENSPLLSPVDYSSQTDNSSLLSPQDQFSDR